MHFSTLAIGAALAIHPIVAMPTQATQVAFLNSLITREENKQAYLTASHDPNCVAGPVASLMLPLPPNFTLDSNASQSICHPLPPSFHYKEFLSLNFGSGEDAIPCGLSMFKNEDCTGYVSNNWYRRDDSCQSLSNFGGHVAAVSLSGCKGPGTPNGKPTDDPNVDPNVNSN